MKNNNNNLPKGWRKVKLEEITNIKMGQSPSSQFYNSRGEGLPFYQGITDFGSKYPNKSVYCTNPIKIAEKGEILFSVRAPVGEINVAIEKSCIGRGIAALSMKNKNNEFLYYLLKYHTQYFKSISGGTTYESIGKDQIAEIELLIPEDINEQKRIADILSAFDDKIEVNNKIIKTLEEMAQEIFKEWFNENSKLKSQKSKYRETIKISDLAWIISGYPFSSKLYNKSKEGFGVVTIKNVQDGNFITECDSFIEEKKIPKNMNQECLISDGDILLSLTGNVGRVCFVYGGKYFLNQRVAKLKPKNSNDLAFIYFLFRQPDMQNLLINMAKGSAQPNLSPVETGEIEITVPAREILDKLNKVINPIYEELIRLKAENQKLAALRDLLLPKLMSGEIRV
jgi:type I restriction enzyme S subunit